MSGTSLREVRIAMRRRTAKEIRAQASIEAADTVGAMLVGIDSDSALLSYHRDGARIVLSFADGSEITLDVTCTTLPDVIG